MSTTADTLANVGKGIVQRDRNRGTLAIWMVIFTEASLFVALFSAYFLEGNNKDRWTYDQPPKIEYAIILLAILVASSFVLHWGERQVKKGLHVKARIIMAVTFVMGLGFLALQAFEYLDHWKSLYWDSDSYGSIFYTITTFHAAHVIVGLLVMAYVLVLPYNSDSPESPYRPYHVAALYWHFVDVVWLFVVIILYAIPNGTVYAH
ncbi:MAG TPA: cytochrome c oxidase subunit 3 [Candidatus Angelobacter sp.]|nr:cytochrome c oxidase subunit 3 [Candidatus Angelobacter sp.]